ncbi:hypothetical protein SEA_UZUMAKI_80 [Arthrobacter phage Uzumaki]|nr:hypothetical protein SEA_UZUMAKI_80 [Arthrobacter phage Uzumaki]
MSIEKLKPSELPIDTVIDDQERGTFRKDAPGLWAELQYTDVNQQELVWDEGGELANRKIYGSKSIDTPSDEYFKDFKVLAWPAAIVEELLESFAMMTGSEAVFYEAVEKAEK